MTSSDLPGPRPPHSCPAPLCSPPVGLDVPATGRLAAPVRLRDQGEVIAAVPALIGFHPERSLVLLAMGGESGKRVGLTLRVDLPPPEFETDVADTAVRSLLLDDPLGAIVLVVAGRPPGAGTDPPHPRFAEHVARELEERGVEVRAVLWAEGTSAGSRWRCYDACGCSGRLPDPASSTVLATAVAGGQVVHRDRAALERLVAPVDDERLRCREEMLVRAVEHELAGEPGGPDAPDISLVFSAISDAQAGRLELDDERVVRLALALSAPAVRDAALLRSAGVDAAGAELLWAALTRETPDPEAAQPAALLAVSALLRGDGALANVALERAERAWPGHHLTGLLRVASQAGIRPAEVRSWLDGCTHPRQQPDGGAQSSRPPAQRSSRRSRRRR